MKSYKGKIKTLPHLKSICWELRQSGKKIVFTNGCFDILHPGHTRYLEETKAMGDYLIVAVNSDKSVQAIKGPNRPILPEMARAELVAALGFVDAVLIFNEKDPFNVIKQLIPHVLVKGGDWAEDEIIGADIVKASGGEVKRIPYVEGFSTTGIIDKILRTFS